MNSQPGESRPEPDSQAATTIPSAALTRALLQCSPLLVYAIDLHGHVLLINRAFTSTTGWDEGDCPDLGALLERLYPDTEYREIVRRVHERRPTSSELTGTELTLRCKDGGDRLVSWSTGWLSDRSGQALGVAFFGSDNTSARNLRHLLFLFRSAVEGVAEGVIITDLAGRILTWNAGATALLGHDAEAMEGKVLAELYSSGDEVEAALEEGGFFAAVVQMSTHGGEQRELSLRLSRLDTGTGAQAARLCILAPPDHEASLSARGDELQQQLDREVLATVEQGARIAELNKQLGEDASEASETLESIRHEAQRDLASVEERLTASKGRADELLSRNENLRDQLKHSEDQLHSRESRVADAERAHAEAEQKAEAANERAAEAEAGAADAQGQIALAATRHGELEDAVRQAEEATKAGDAELIAQELELERLGTALAESRIAIEESEQRRTELNQQLEGAQAETASRIETAVDEVEDHWDRKRQAVDERHREAIFALQQQLATERVAIEEQVSRDILAVEDRAEAERGKDAEGHLRDREDWESALELARAETEARYRDEIEVLRRRLATGGGLQTHLLASRAVAVAAANMSGVLVGWSGGAAELDGRSEEEALGSRIHQDVLCMEGVDWKSMVGKIIISGHLEQEHVLIASDGTKKPLLLVADLVKGAGGNPIGLTEFLVPRLPTDLVEGEITDVSDIMEFDEGDDDEVMSLRGAADEVELDGDEAPAPAIDTATGSDTTGEADSPAPKKKAARKKAARKKAPRKKASGKKATGKKAAAKPRA
jgi:PAS domain S-box-containing protein